MKTLFYNGKVWTLALCLPLLSTLMAVAQPNCAVGIWASPSPANAMMINFEAYPMFDSTCFSPNSTYTWGFGDNTTGTGKNIVHTYNAPGIYGVCLTATTTFGFTVTQCDTVFVGNPQVCLLNYTSAQNGNTITLVPTTGGSPNCFNVNTVYTYSWGDGTSTVTGSTDPQSHTYASNGTYTVCLNAFTPGLPLIQGTCNSFVITNTNPTTNISGMVNGGGACLNSTVNVYLIAVDGPEQHMFTLNGGPDSCYYWFNISQQPSRNWIIWADPVNNADYLPTYLGDVMYYTDATIFSTPTSFGQFNPTINLIPNFYDSLPWDSLPPGLGTITGTITGAGTTVTSVLNGLNVTATFQPQNARVIVLSSAGMPVAVAAVNANGTFSVPNLPEGQYTLRVECPKVPSQPVTFTLEQGNMSRNFFFTTNGAGINSTTATQKSIAGEKLTVAPNPSSSYISFYGAEGKVSILDAQGRVVLSTTNHLNINVAALPSGLYTILGTSKTGATLTTRFVKN